jgi:hypothetical protein
MLGIGGYVGIAQSVSFESGGISKAACSLALHRSDASV